MTRQEWKDEFKASLWSKMNPDSSEGVMCEGAQVFGSFFVRVNSKKHKRGDEKRSQRRGPLYRYETVAYCDAVTWPSRATG